MCAKAAEDHATVETKAVFDYHSIEATSLPVRNSATLPPSLAWLSLIFPILCLCTFTLATDISGATSVLVSPSVQATRS
jgi:hypothetical protein